MNQLESLHILLAEDDDDDVRITRRAIRKAEVMATLDVARDGQESLDYLNQTGAFVGAHRPDLVLLDINLPRVNGLQVLKQIKQSPELHTIPTVMLTTSARQEEVNLAYLYGANGFISKPLRFTEFVDVLRTMSIYWSNIARVPDKTLAPNSFPPE